MMFLLLAIIALLIVYHDVSMFPDWALGLLIAIAVIDFITVCTMVSFRHYKNDIVNSKVQTKNNLKCKIYTDKKTDKKGESN